MPSLFEYVIPTVIDREDYAYEFITQRNYRNVYTVPYEDAKVVLPLRLEKTLISDQNLNKILDTDFEYFTPDTIITPDAFSLGNGTIFKPTGQGILPKEQYTYYIIKSNEVLEIPNYKTLEVLLSERGLGLDSIRTIEADEFADLITYENGNIDKAATLTEEVAPASGGGGGGGGGGGKPPKKEEDKILEWTPDMELKSLSEKFAELTALAAEASAIADAAKESAQNTIDAAIAAKNQAEAEAIAAQQAAATAEQESAAAQAQAQQAEAEAQNLTSDQVATLEGLQNQVGVVEVDITELDERVEILEDN